jgi:hypothetical protein
MTLKPKLPPSNINVESPAAAEENMLTVVSTAGVTSAPNTGSFASGRRTTYHAHLSNALANLDMNAEVKFDLKVEDLLDLQELGQGNGGSVKKAQHVPTGTIMAKKVLPFPHAFRGINSKGTLDRPHRRETIRQETDSSRTANHARLQVPIYRLLLRSFSGRSQYMYLHGVHGQGLTRQHL